MSNNCRSKIFSSICLLTVLLWQPVTIAAEDLFPQEKLYVQTDKRDYLTRDSIWFRAYLVNTLSNMPDTISRYVYAELINTSKEVIKRVKVRLENGAYSGYIPLAEDLATDSYLLRFYTRYMENFGEGYFFKRIINIVNPQSILQKQIILQPDSDSDYAVSFHPEGGDIPIGIYTKVAFKAINTSGLGEDIQGVIVNQQGDTINQFESVHRGLGSFIYAAKADEQCFAICKNNKNIEKTFELPRAKEDAIALQIFRQNGNTIVNISKTENKNLPEPLYLTFQCRGRVLYFKKWNTDNKIVLIPEESLPTGVLQILLMDANRNPVSERLIFNTNKEEKVNTRFKTNESTYNKREEVKATVEITDSKNKPLKANLSISVIDNNGTQYDASTNILSTLLLTSDLKGTIEDPAYFFTNETENTKEQLDLVMLTHGWTRYDVNKVLQEEVKTEKDFETSQSITGTLKGGLLNKKKANEPVTLLASEYGFFDRTSTDNEGKFRFNNFEFPESAQYLIQGKAGTEILWDEEVFPAVNKNILPTRTDDLLGFENLIKENRKYVFNNGIKTIDLKSIIVTAAIPKKKDRYSIYSSPFSKKIGSEEIKRLHAPNMYKLLFGSSPKSPPMAGSSSESSNVLILVDNIEVRPEDLLGYSADNVESIEFLSTADDKNIFAFSGKYTGGIILVTTKTGNEETNNTYPNTKVITPLGYQITKEFYSPAYTTKEQVNDNIPDSRTTIYWNPNMMTQEDGKSDIHFYTSDNPENYTVIIEGITDEGKIVHLVDSIK